MGNNSKQNVPNDKYSKIVNRTIYCVSLLLFVFGIFCGARAKYLKKTTSVIYASTQLGDINYHFNKNCSGLSDNYKLIKVHIDDLKDTKLVPCFLCVSGDNFITRYFNNSPYINTIGFYSLSLFFYAMLLTWMRKAFRVSYANRRLIKRLDDFELEDRMALEFNIKLPDSKEHYKPTATNCIAVSKFLKLFGNAQAFKYTTHIWDNASKILDYNEFETNVITKLNEEENNVQELAPHLWNQVCAFLNNPDATKEWNVGPEKIKVGYNIHMKEWLRNHPNSQPFSMPLSAFPESISPGAINQRTLSTFKDVVELFKHVIEFRDNDFYNSVRRIFKIDGFNIDKEKLETLKGKIFYTDTEEVKEALKIIASNISMRKDFPNIVIECIVKDTDEREMIRLNILQVGSYAGRNVKNEKVLALDENSDLFKIKQHLMNLCDFSVESKYLIGRKDKEKNIRINYLTCSDGIKGAYELDSDCEGFKYILTFYNYKK